MLFHSYIEIFKRGGGFAGFHLDNFQRGICLRESYLGKGKGIDVRADEFIEF